MSNTSHTQDKENKQNENVMEEKENINEKEENNNSNVLGTTKETINQAKEKALDVANEAKDKALEFANQAKEKAKEKLQVLGKDLYKTVKEIIKEGKARVIVIKNEKGEKIFSISSIVGIAATLFLGRALAPLAVAVGWMTKYTIEFEKNEKNGEE